MYAQPADLIDRFGATQISQVATPDRFSVISIELLNDVVDNDDISGYEHEEQQAATETLNRINKAIDDAVDEINFYLSSKYSLPFEPVPTILLKITCDIARYNLYQSEANEEVKERYENVIKLLNKINSGDLELFPSSPGDSSIKQQNNLPKSFSAERVYTQDSLSDY